MTLTFEEVFKDWEITHDGETYEVVGDGIGNYMRLFRSQLSNRCARAIMDTGFDLRSFTQIHPILAKGFTQDTDDADDSASIWFARLDRYFLTVSSTDEIMRIVNALGCSVSLASYDRPFRHAYMVVHEEESRAKREWWI